MGFFEKSVEEMEAKRDVWGLIDRLLGKKSLDHERATSALVKIGEPSVKPLLKSLYHDDRVARCRVAQALGKIGGVRVTEPLIQDLKDEDKRVRERAVEALGDIRDVRAVEPLIQTLKDKHRSIIEKAVKALGGIGDVRAVEPLIQTLKEKDWSVRCSAANALGEIGDGAAVPALILALGDSEKFVRNASARTLVKIGADEKKTRDTVTEPLKESAEYFEDDVPSGDGVCSDNNCPCREDEIPRGTGYLYIDEEIVDFRRRYPSLTSAREAMQQTQERIRASGTMFGGFYRIGPILVCEKGARLRNLDLKVAAADAKYWWETGKVPLRVTPLKKE